MNTKLHIIRKNSILGMDRDIDVIVDGEVVATIKEDDSFELKVAPGDHTIRFDLKRSWSNLFTMNMTGTSNPIDFQINAGETRTIKVKPKTEYILYHALIFAVGIGVLILLDIDKYTGYFTAFLLIALPMILLDRSLLRVSFEE